MTSERIYILAGNASIATNWIRNLQVTPGDPRFVYVSNENQLRGLKNARYVVLDGFWERDDAVTLWACLQMGQTVGLPLPSYFTTQQIKNPKPPKRVPPPPSPPVVVPATPPEPEEKAETDTHAEHVSGDKQIVKPEEGHMFKRIRRA